MALWKQWGRPNFGQRVVEDTLLGNIIIKQTLSLKDEEVRIVVQPEEVDDLVIKLLKIKNEMGGK